MNKHFLLQIIICITLCGCSIINTAVPAETSMPDSVGRLESTASPVILEKTLATTVMPKYSPTAELTNVYIPTHTEIPYGYGPENFPHDVNPLTGLRVGDPKLLDRRPLAIKITNYPRNVRPQSGLSLADIVYEYYLEQNVTRFIGIFYGNEAEKVGPVHGLFHGTGAISY